MKNKYAHPEWLSMIIIHAVRWKLNKILEEGFSSKAVAALRPYLPYSIITDGDGLPGVTNRSYNALGVTGPARYDFCWPDYPTFHIPKEKCRIQSDDREQTWVYAGCEAPWQNKEAAEHYLDQLEYFIDFSLDDLEEPT